jgi:hypothetical protein
MFKIELSSEIHRRREFAALCNARRLWRAVEVGTDQGVFAAEFLENWGSRGEGLLFCCDPWCEYPEMRWDREADRAIALTRLAEHAGRVRIIRAKSPDAIAALPETFMLEFCYVDGAHDYESVRRDLPAWWNRLYPSGPTILAGHDFCDSMPGVKKAVTEFARERNLTVRLTREGETNASWYIYRNEPQSLLCLHP